MKVLVIGAQGTIGGAAASALTAFGDEVVGVSRSSNPGVDITDPASIAALFEAVGQVDAVVSAAGHVPWKPLADLGHDDYLSGLLGKTLSQIDVVRIGTPYVTDGGSFTLTTGILAREPFRSGVAASTANGAVEAFVMAAAHELPRGLRINAMSPTVLVESPALHATFPGYPPIAAAEVGQGFVRLVHGLRTGQVLTLDER